jgi:hypothetical protein
LIIVAALVFAAVVGGIAWNAGLHHGIEQSGKIVAAPAGTQPYAYPPYPYPYYGWHGGFFFFPFLGIILFFVLIRALFWGRRGGWHRHGCGNRDEDYEEMHRRMHERMSNVSV